MNDPLHDQVPHMVPADPDWPVGTYERILLIACAAVAGIAVGYLWMEWLQWP
jgi:hypothetical protein